MCAFSRFPISASRCSGLTALGLATLILLAAPSAQAGGNLLLNGSFENGSFMKNGNNDDNLPIGSTAITDWTVTNAETDWLENGNPFGVTASDGSFFLDLT
jgi:hypothetical protein